MADCGAKSAISAGILSVHVPFAEAMENGVLRVVQGPLSDRPLWALWCAAPLIRNSTQISHVR